MCGKLTGYKFVVEWKAGKDHQIADALSRAPVWPAEAEDDDVDHVQVASVHDAISSATINNLELEFFSKSATTCTAYKQAARAMDEDINISNFVGQRKKKTPYHKSQLKHFEAKTYNQAPIPIEMKGKCWTCGSSKHHTQKCSEDKNSLTCYHCGKQGHMSVICMDKLRKKASSSGNISVSRTLSRTHSPESGSDSQSESNNEQANTIYCRSTITASNRPTPKVRLKFQTLDNEHKFEFSATPDTGATRSIIANNILSQHNIPFKSTSCRLFAANGNEMSCPGQVRLKVDSHIINAVVSSDLNNEILISWHDLKALNIIPSNFPCIITSKVAPLSIQVDDIQVDDIITILKNTFHDVLGDSLEPNTVMKVKPFDITLPTELLTDASRLHGLGFCLIQHDKENNIRLISCGSCSLTPTQSRYATIELECLAIQWAIHKCEFWLRGICHFKVVTDHRPLVGVFNKPVYTIENPRLQRMCGKLTGYKFVVEWKAGKDHQIADALSRAPVWPAEAEDDDVDHVQVASVHDAISSATINNLELEFFSKSATTCTAYKQLIAALKEGKVPQNLPTNHIAKCFSKVWNNLSLYDDDKYSLVLLDGHRIVVPYDARPDILHILHLSHQGLVKTKQLARHFHQALAEFRLMPRADGFSPADLMFGRTPRGLLPAMRTPVDLYAGQEARQTTLNKSFFQHSSKPNLPCLRVGDIVRIQNPKTKRWTQKGSIIASRDNSRSYEVESAAGLITSINRILTKMLLDDERINTIIFFGISIISLLLCFVIHFVVQRTEFVKFYIESCNSAKEDEDRRHITLEPCEVDILEAADSKRGSYGVLSLQSSSSLPTDSAFQSVENVSATSSAVQGADIYVETYRVGTGEERQRVITKPMYKVQDELKKIRRGVLARWDVAKLVWPYMLSIGLAYFVTLCLFPGIESEVTSCNLHSWMPVILMAIFNLFDFIGKILTCIPYDWTRKKLVLWSVARVLLIPLLVMCATPRVNSLIPGEGWPMFFSLALGLSNGILGSVPMIMAPSRVPNEHKEITATSLLEGMSWSDRKTNSNWAGHLTRRADDRWTTKTTIWIPNKGGRKRGIPKGMWVDDIAKFDSNWVERAADREDWRSKKGGLFSALSLVGDDDDDNDDG
ncbi:Equilibrative nucleoside transporter 4 [Nymphon striatum]|nr:Equilibrative nucleoside transporter 4 [Nymphon striatum]